MLFRKKKDFFLWTQEEEDQAYKEFLEACETFPEEALFSENECKQIHDRIFGLSRTHFFLKTKKFWIIAAAAATMLSTFITATAFQSQIRRFFLRESPIATDVAVLPPDNGENSEYITYYWDTSYIPEGYVLDYGSITEMDTLIAYDDGNGKSIGISTMALHVSASIDTEDTQKQEIQIAGGSGYLYTTPDESKTRLLLLYEDCILFIDAYKMPLEEVLKVANSLYKTTITYLNPTLTSNGNIKIIVNPFEHCDYSVILQLQQYIDGCWKPIDSWSLEKKYDHTIYKQCSLQSGGSYRACAYVDIYDEDSGELIESSIKYSPAVTAN